MEAKRILVTGGAGFIGSSIAKECERLGHEVTVIDNYLYGDFRNLAGFKGRIVTGDIRAVDWGDMLNGVDTVFHMAAITDTRVDDQKLVMETNVDASVALIEAARDSGAKVVYASSAAVYGNLPSPLKEDGPTSPLNIYGFSKLALDNFVLSLKKKLGADIPVVGLRFFNVHGPGERYKGNFASMVFQATMQALDSGSVRLFKHGEQYRDHLHVRNAVDACLLAMEGARAGIFNVGLGHPTTFNRILEAVEEALGRKIEIEWIDNPYPFYQDHTLADITKAKELLGYEPDSDPFLPMVEYIRGLSSGKR